MGVVRQGGAYKTCSVNEHLIEIEYFPHRTPQNFTVFATPKIFFSNYVFNNPGKPPQEPANS